MARYSRIKSKSGIYHIMLRGNERKDIFFEKEDFQKFFEIVNQKKQGNAFYLHAICLMSNHIHMMISEGTEDVAKVMKRITVSYVCYFNRKYQRVGHLFQDRYKSEVVESEEHILSLARYIHQNPIKAGLVKEIGDYPWSSYASYLKPDDRYDLDKELVIGLFSSNKTKAQKEYTKYMNEQDPDIYLDIKEAAEKMGKREARELYEKMLGENEAGPDVIKGLRPEEVIREFKDQTKFSIREIAAVTGINKDRINKMIKT